MKKNIKDFIPKLLVVCLVVSMVPMFALTGAMAVTDDPYVTAPDTESGSATATVETPTTVQNGTAKAEVSNETMEAAVEAAVDAAIATGKAPTVEISVDTKNANTLELTLPIESVTTLSEENNASLSINSDIGGIKLDNAALDVLVGQAATDKPITLEIAPQAKDGLLTAQQDALGSTQADVYDLSVMSGSTKIDFKKGSGSSEPEITITLPYSGQATSSTIRAYYLDNNGYFERHRDAAVDEDGNVVFTTNHLSTYVVTTTQLIKEFGDVPNGQYFTEAVDWAVAHKVTQGANADGTLFLPNQTLDRRQIVTFLWRQAGSPAPATTVNPFTDVNAGMGSDYYNAILWAVGKGITTGTTPTTFEPTKSCTRSEIVTFLYRAATDKSGSVNVNFNDVPAGAWYNEALRWAVGNGVANGVGDNLFRPARTCVRGEAVTFMFRALAD